eukprot:scaffold9149_cov85-Phaeocystis_antarctica.AAC.1
MRWVDGVELSRKKGRRLSILATGSSHRPEWARCTPGGLMGVEPLIALPPRVLVAGRLQCGAARAGVRRGHGECAELAYLARGSSKLFTARHAENGTFPRGVGENTYSRTVHSPRRALNTSFCTRGSHTRPTPQYRGFT